MSRTTKLIIGLVLMAFALCGIAKICLGVSPLYVGPGDVARLSYWNGTIWLPLMLGGIGAPGALYVGPGNVARMAYWTGTTWKEVTGSTFTASSDTLRHTLYFQGTSNALRDTGGAARGTYAVDLQYERLLIGQVAAGAYSVITGGYANKDSGDYSFIGGGQGNSIQRGIFGALGSTHSVIVCGFEDSIINSRYSTIGGGFHNKINPRQNIYATNNVIVGGSGNINRSRYSGAIVGGDGNLLDSNSEWSYIGGGESNTITSSTNQDDNAICGGIGNTIQQSSPSTIAGGANNGVLNSNWATVVSGRYDSCVSSSYGFVGGGYKNWAFGFYSAISGGRSNIARGIGSVCQGDSAIAPYNGSYCFNASGVPDSARKAGQYYVNAPGGLWNNGGYIEGDSVFGYTNSQVTAESKAIALLAADTFKFYSGDSIYVGRVMVQIGVISTGTGGDTIWMCTKPVTDSTSRLFVAVGATFASVAWNHYFPADTICVVHKPGATTLHFGNVRDAINYGTVKWKHW